MKLTREDVSRLQEEAEFGDRAASAKELISEITTRIVNRCIAEFCAMPVIHYLNVDNSQIIVLQLKMKVAKEIETEILKAIQNGEEAAKQLNKHGG